MFEQFDQMKIELDQLASFNTSARNEHPRRHTDEIRSPPSHVHARAGMPTNISSRQRLSTDHHRRVASGNRARICTYHSSSFRHQYQANASPCRRTRPTDHHDTIYHPPGR